MLLDRPGRFLYRHGVNTYWLMRLLTTNYRLYSVGGGLVVLLIVVWLLSGHDVPVRMLANH